MILCDTRNIIHFRNCFQHLLAIVAQFLVGAATIHGRPGMGNGAGNLSSITLKIYVVVHPRRICSNMWVENGMFKEFKVGS